MKRVLAAVAAAVTGGCVSVTQVPMREQFDPAEAAYVLREGPHTVAGQSFMRTVGGEVRTCAGNDVDLVPATRYAAERMRILYGSDVSALKTASYVQSVPASTDPEYVRLARSTKCDADGRFSFAKVADGTYYVITFVVWSTGEAYSMPQGGRQMRRVVAGPDSANLIISP